MTDLTRFLSDVKLELTKVVWPSYQELVGSVIIVLILVCAFAVYLGVVDFGLYRVAERIFQY